MARDENAVVRYVRETRAELAKVSWPTRRETINLTLVVLATVVASSLFLGAFDALFSWAVTQIL